MKNNNIVSSSGKKTRKSILLAIILGIAALGTGLVVVYAIAYVASLSDSVSVIDEASLRTSAKDTIPVIEGPNSDNKITDNLNPNENVGNNNHIITDGVNPSDFPVSADRNADTISILDDGPSFPALSAADLVSITDAPAYSPVLGDMMSASDSLAISIAQGVGNGLEEEEATNQGGPHRIVYDESFLEKNPLRRMEISSLYVVDGHGSVITQVKAGQSINISATVGNFQKSDQAYVVITQITDKDDYTVQILFAYGTTKSGNAADIALSWLAEHDGNYKMKIMVWTTIANPVPLAESAAKEILVQ